MRVLHIGSIAGVPQMLSKAQRKMGYQSDVLDFEIPRYGYPLDICYNLDIKRKPWRAYKLPLKAYKVMQLDYDVLHFHYNSCIPFSLDMPLWKVLGKIVIMHHHGTDIRSKGEDLMCSRFADRIYVSTPDLLKWSPKAQWLPNPIDLEHFPFVGVNDKSEIFNIIHAPSDTASKGTKYILQAIDKLKREGYPIKFTLLENANHSAVIEVYKQADIIVDQLLIGWYGMVSVEGMALGKPVCSYIRKDLTSFIPNGTICNVTPETLVDRLRELLDDRGEREAYGLNGRKYVQQVHDSMKVAKSIAL
jgi:glycosyltransferase involved in cell wall biosynthesis